MNLLRYLKYRKLIDKYCNDENGKYDCENCPVKKECDNYYDMEELTLVKLYYCLHHLPYDITEKISNYWTKHKKTHYRCDICGIIEAPFFRDQDVLKASISYAYGWYKAKYFGHTIWVCYHCSAHIHDYPFDEWLQFVEDKNKNTLEMIKKKDLEYYNEHFKEGQA